MRLSACPLVKSCANLSSLHEKVSAKTAARRVKGKNLVCFPICNDLVFCCKDIEKTQNIKIISSFFPTIITPFYFITQKSILHFVFLPLLPYLNRVNDVLPENIATWTHWRQRIQIGDTQPDSESGILLSKGLTCFLCTTKEMANEATNGKLDYAQQQA